MKRVSRQGPAPGPADRGGAVGLLRRLSGSPALGEYIRQLPARIVVRLIDEIGLEDSQEIVAALDARQFRETMSLALWASPRAGRDELLDVDQLVRWSELWIEEGDVVLSQRMTQLGEDFVVACFRQLLSAVDRTKFGVESQGLEIGNYVVFPREQKHWPRVVAMVVALWGREPDFVLRTLRRCSRERDFADETTAEPRRAQDSLLQDLSAERAANRARAGHVSPMHAALFLSAAKTARLEDLCSLRGYDLNTADYLEKAECLAHEVKGADARAQIEPVVLVSRAVAPRLTDPRVASANLCLERAITDLAETHPQIASRRMRELAYLANVLVAGAESQGKRYTEKRAVQAAMAIANLGATFLLRHREAHRARVAEILARDPGVVGLFQIGFNLLADLPRRCCEGVYRAKDAQSRRRGHVVYLEMEEILGASVLTDLVNEGRYPEAKSVIDELSAVMDSAACVALRILIDPIPAYPNVLGDLSTDAETYVDRGHRPVATVDDLERIASFLAGLADH